MAGDPKNDGWEADMLAQQTTAEPTAGQANETTTTPEVPATTPAPEANEPTGGKKTKKPKKGKKDGDVTKTATATKEAPAAEEAKEAADYSPGGLKLTAAQKERLDSAAAALKGALHEAKKGQPLRLDPECVVIAGLDTPVDDDDPLYDEESNESQESQNWVPIMTAMGMVGSSVALVVRSMEGFGDVPWVLDGRTRTRALRAANANLRKAGEPANLLTCAVEAGLADSDQAVMASALNDYRRQGSEVGKARRAARLFRRLKDVDQVALAMGGISGKQVQNYLKFHAAPEQFKKAVEKDKLSLTAATKLLRIEGAGAQVEALKAILDDYEEGHQPTVAEVEGYVRTIVDPESSKGGGGGKRKKGAKKSETWAPGTAPSKRFAKKVVGKFLEKHDPDDTTAMTRGEAGEVLLKFANFLLEGSPPPKILSGCVKSVLGEAEAE